MNRALSRQAAFALLGCLSAESALAASPGTYVRMGSSAKTSASVVVHEASPSSITLSLEVIAKPSPSATMARSGNLTRQSLKVGSGVAKYEEQGFGAEGCTLVFRLDTARIQVSQSGLCAEFGVGIDASGTYTLRTATP